MKVLITGAKGQLGYDILKEIKKRDIECVGLGRNDLDITNETQVKECIHNYKPEAVIHCAAYTSVDKAEDEAYLCRKVNIDGTAYVAEASKAVNAKLVYISTDYVFSGEGKEPYEISDKTSPLSVYGQSKLDGENIIKEILNKYFIVRISWAFGQNGNNFVKTMLKLGREKDEVNVVDDQIGSPTYTADVSSLICDMVHKEEYAVYHATNEGFCSWAEFAEEIFKQSGLKTKVNHIPSSEYPTKAKRPCNSKLSKISLDQHGFKRLPIWQDALSRYLKSMLAAR